MPPRNEIGLDRELLETLFKQLDAELEKSHARARIYVVGGARITLGLREGWTTRDVDVTFREAEGSVYRPVGTVARLGENVNRQQSRASGGICPMSSRRFRRTGFIPAPAGI